FGAPAAATRSCTICGCRGRFFGRYLYLVPLRRCSTESCIIICGMLNVRCLPRLMRIWFFHSPSGVGTWTIFGHSSAIHHAPLSDSCCFTDCGSGVVYVP